MCAQAEQVCVNSASFSMWNLCSFAIKEELLCAAEGRTRAVRLVIPRNAAE